MPETNEEYPDVIIGEYKGSPVISLPLTKDGRVKFTFGLTKAKAVLRCLDDIKEFVEENEKDEAE